VRLWKYKKREILKFIRSTPVNNAFRAAHEITFWRTQASRRIIKLDTCWKTAGDAGKETKWRYIIARMLLATHEAYYMMLILHWRVSIYVCIIAYEKEKYILIFDGTKEFLICCSHMESINRSYSINKFSEKIITWKKRKKGIFPSGKITIGRLFISSWRKLIFAFQQNLCLTEWEISLTFHVWEAKYRCHLPISTLWHRLLHCQVFLKKKVYTVYLLNKESYKRQMLCAYI
jgi:hypothetical protein